MESGKTFAEKPKIAANRTVLVRSVQLARSVPVQHLLPHCFGLFRSSVLQHTHSNGTHSETAAAMLCSSVACNARGEYAHVSS